MYISLTDCPLRGAHMVTSLNTNSILPVSAFACDAWLSGISFFICIGFLLVVMMHCFVVMFLF